MVSDDRTRVLLLLGRPVNGVPRGRLAASKV